MDMNAIFANAAALEKELDWFKAVLDRRLAAHAEKSLTDIGGLSADLPAPNLDNEEQSMYARIIRHYGAAFPERFILMLALAPHLKPHLLDVFYAINQDSQRGFTEFGGVKGQNHGGFL